MRRFLKKRVLAVLAGLLLAGGWSLSVWYGWVGLPRPLGRAIAIRLLSAGGVDAAELEVRRMDGRRVLFGAGSATYGEVSATWDEVRIDNPFALLREGRMSLVVVRPRLVLNLDAPGAESRASSGHFNPSAPFQLLALWRIHEIRVEDGHLEVLREGLSESATFEGHVVFPEQLAVGSNPVARLVLNADGITTTATAGVDLALAEVSGHIDMQATGMKPVLRLSRFVGADTEGIPDLDSARIVADADLRIGLDGLRLVRGSVRTDSLAASLGGNFLNVSEVQLTVGDWIPGSVPPRFALAEASQIEVRSQDAGVLAVHVLAEVSGGDHVALRIDEVRGRLPAGSLHATAVQVTSALPGRLEVPREGIRLETASGGLRFGEVHAAWRRIAAIGGLDGVRAGIDGLAMYASVSGGLVSASAEPVEVVFGKLDTKDPVWSVRTALALRGAMHGATFGIKPGFEASGAGRARGEARIVFKDQAQVVMSTGEAAVPVTGTLNALWDGDAISATCGLDLAAARLNIGDGVEVIVNEARLDADGITFEAGEGRGRLVLRFAGVSVQNGATVLAERLAGEVELRPFELGRLSGWGARLDSGRAFAGPVALNRLTLNAAGGTEQFIARGGAFLRGSDIEARFEQRGVFGDDFRIHGQVVVEDAAVFEVEPFLPFAPELEDWRVSGRFSSQVRTSVARGAWSVDGWLRVDPTSVRAPGDALRVIDLSGLLNLEAGSDRPVRVWSEGLLRAGRLVAGTIELDNPRLSADYKGQELHLSEVRADGFGGVVSLAPFKIPLGGAVDTSLGLEGVLLDRFLAAFPDVPIRGIGSIRGNIPVSLSANGVRLGTSHLVPTEGQNIVLELPELELVQGRRPPWLQFGHRMRYDVLSRTQKALRQVAVRELTLEFPRNSVDDTGVILRTQGSFVNEEVRANVEVEVRVRGELGDLVRIGILMSGGGGGL
jgi:hypothetical protein